jgi:hypothetical protein
MISMDMLSILLIAAGVVTIAATSASDVKTLVRPAAVNAGGAAATSAWSLRASATQAAVGLALMMTGFTLDQPGHPLALACMALLLLTAVVALGAWRLERRGG